MACIDDPNPGSGCLSLLTNFNPYNQSGLWSNGETSPSGYGCYGWVYVGRYKRLDTFGQMRVYGDPPDVPDDISRIGYHASGIGDIECTLNNSNSTVHSTEVDEYTYSDPYDFLNNGDLWVDVTHVLYYDYYILIDEDGEPDCVPGETFNPLTGICEPIPGWCPPNSHYYEPDGLCYPDYGYELIDGEYVLKDNPDCNDNLKTYMSNYINGEPVIPPNAIKIETCYWRNEKENVYCEIETYVPTIDTPMKRIK